MKTRLSRSAISVSFYAIGEATFLTRLEVVDTGSLVSSCYSYQSIVRAPFCHLWHMHLDIWGNLEDKPRLSE